MATVTSSKRRLRKQIFGQAQQRSETYYHEASQKIFYHLTQWPVFQRSRKIHSFLSLSSEPDTYRIIRYCWDHHKHIVVPYVQSDTQHLGHSFLQSFDQLSPGYAKIPEPRDEERQTANLDQLDLILVPGVAFDHQGGRLGYGKGYYDRFLKGRETFRLGLAFHFQLVDEVPQAVHDVRMHGLVTEEGIRLIRSH